MSDAKDALESPKISTALDQIGEDTDRAISKAVRLISGNKLKLVSPATIRRLKKNISLAEKTYDAIEQERGEILFEGKDTTKYLEKRLSDHVAALDNLEKELALFEGAANAALGVALHAFFSRYGEYVGYGKNLMLPSLSSPKSWLTWNRTLKMSRVPR